MPGRRQNRRGSLRTARCGAPALPAKSAAGPHPAVVDGLAKAAPAPISGTACRRAAPAAHPRDLCRAQGFLEGRRVQPVHTVCRHPAFLADARPHCRRLKLNRHSATKVWKDWKFETAAHYMSRNALAIRARCTDEAIDACRTRQGRPPFLHSAACARSHGRKRGRRQRRCISEIGRIRAIGRRAAQGRLKGPCQVRRLRGRRAVRIRLPRLAQDLQALRGQRARSRPRRLRLRRPRVREDWEDAAGCVPRQRSCPASSQGTR